MSLLRSPLTGRLRKKIASYQVTIADAEVDTRGGHYYPVDDEGVPAEKVVLRGEKGAEELPPQQEERGLPWDKVE
ncbi:MAG: metallopeptidase TldD-related protein [Thermofilaceae archaeon]